MKTPHTTSLIGKTSALILLALAVGLVLCELTLRLADRLNPNYVVVKQGGGNHPRGLISEAPPLDYALTPNFQGRDQNPFGDFDVPISINQYGFRDSEEEYSTEHLYLMGIGDPVVYGEGVNVEESFLGQLEIQLQKEANPSFRVVKAGVPGYSERQAVALLRERYPLFKPKLVILSVTASEAWRNVFPYRNEQGFIVDSRLGGRYFVFDEKLYHSNYKNPVLSYLDAWQKAHLLLPTFLKQRRKYIKDKLFAGLRRAETETATDKPETEFPYLDKTLEVIAEFHELSRTLGFTPVVLHKDSEVEGGKKIADFCKNNKIPFLDVAPLFALCKRQISYTFPHDGYWNASTHRMVAELLFNFLTAQEHIPTANSTPKK